MLGEHTLPSSARLRQRSDFAALRGVEGRARGTFFMCRYGPVAEIQARLGMAVSRKVSVRAVERNRIKRQIRESFREHRHMLPAVDILVIAHHRAAAESSARLREDLDRLWSRIHTLK